MWTPPLVLIGLGSGGSARALPSFATSAVAPVIDMRVYFDCVIFLAFYLILFIHQNLAEESCETLQYEHGCNGYKNTTYYPYQRWGWEGLTSLRYSSWLWGTRNTWHWWSLWARPWPWGSLTLTVDRGVHGCSSAAQNNITWHVTKKKGRSEIWQLKGFFIANLWARIGGNRRTIVRYTIFLSEHLRFKTRLHASLTCCEIIDNQWLWIHIFALTFRCLSKVPRRKHMYACTIQSISMSRYNYIE